MALTRQVTFIGFSSSLLQLCMDYKVAFSSTVSLIAQFPAVSKWEASQLENNQHDHFSDLQDQ